MTRTKRLKDRYFDQQGIPGNTTANAACGQQITLPADNSQRGLRTTVNAACGQQLTRPAHNTALRLRGASK